MKGGINKACAACKYQRRRCSKNCILSPYFPADKPKMFSNAHRLFGVSNMIRILNQVAPDERDEAMKSLIYEADIRAKYPQSGCQGVILQYQALIYRALDELRYVRMLIAYYKQDQHPHLKQNLQDLVLMDHGGGHHDKHQNQNLVLMNYGGVSLHDSLVYATGVDVKPVIQQSPLPLYREIDVPRTIATNFVSSSNEITNVAATKAKFEFNTRDIEAKCAKLTLTEVGERPSNCNEFDISQYMLFENKGKSSEETTSAEENIENIEDDRKH